MSYRSGIFIAVLLHVFLILALTKIYWPVDNKIGWHNAVIVRSYLFSPKQVSENKSINQSKPKNKLSEKSQIKQKKVVHQTIVRKDASTNKSQHNKFSANLTQGQTNRLLTLLHNAIAEKQVYPANAQILGQQGKVILNFNLQTSGEITNIKIEKSSGFALLDNAAIAAVKDTSPFTQMKLSKNLNLSIEIKFSK